MSALSTESLRYSKSAGNTALNRMRPIVVRTTGARPSSGFQSFGSIEAGSAFSGSRILTGSCSGWPRSSASSASATDANVGICSTFFFSFWPSVR
jgi:hypothetical protein